MVVTPKELVRRREQRLRRVLARGPELRRVPQQTDHAAARSLDRQHAALDAVGGNFLGILFNALSGRLEYKVERVVQQKIQPMVLSICRELPALMASQQRLAGSLPAFRPYATLEQRDIDECETDMRREFASR